MKCLILILMLASPFAMAADRDNEATVLQGEQCIGCTKASNGNVNLTESPDAVAAKYCEVMNNCPSQQNNNTKPTDAVKENKPIEI